MGAFETPRIRAEHWLWGRQEVDDDATDDGTETEGDDDVDEDEDDSDFPGRQQPNPPGLGRPPGPPGQQAQSTTSIPPTTTSSESISESSTTSTIETSTTETTTSTTPPAEPPTSTTSSSSIPVPETTSAQAPISTLTSLIPSSASQSTSFSLVSRTSALPVFASPSSTTSFSLVSQSSAFSFISRSTLATSIITSQSIPLVGLSSSAPVIFTTPSTTTPASSRGTLFSSSSISSTTASSTALDATSGISSSQSSVSATALGVGLSVGGGATIITALLLFLLRRRKQKQNEDRRSSLDRSFWYQVSGNQPPAADPINDWDSSSYAPAPVAKRYNTAPMARHDEAMPAPALFIPPPRTMNATQQQVYSNERPYSAAYPPLPPLPTPTSTVSTGILTRTWFPRSMTTKLHLENGKAVRTNGPAIQRTNGMNESEVASKMEEIEHEMREQELRWEESRREMEARKSGFTVTTNGRGIADDASDWESGIGDQRSTRYASGLSGLDDSRNRWENGTNSWSEMPKFRDPVTSIIEQVREKTGNSPQEYVPEGSFRRLDEKSSAG